MDDQPFALLVLLVGASWMFAAFTAWRIGNEARDIKLMAASGSVVSIVALVLLVA